MAPPTGVNGVLPVSVLQKNTQSSTPRGPKASQPKLKLVLRRLPPGLTKSEFEAILGDEWKLGAGKVDWLVYKKGKISKDLAKPSRPSRAYLHVTAQTYVLALNEVVRQSSFNDAAKSAQDPALAGPPSLEYAPYPRMPGGRRKNDPRQGTIDQDQEFKDFLESLTNPITKPSAAEGDDHKEAKVTTTPLIEALREKKANKEKPQNKGSKHGRGEPKDDTAEKVEKKILSKGNKDPAASSNDKSRKATKAEKAAKEAVKVLNKEAAVAKESTSTQSGEKGTAPASAPERKRGNVSIAKSILQRDLGLAPPSTRRRGAKRDAASTAATGSAAQPEETPTSKPKGKDTATTPSVPTPSEKPSPQSPKKNTRAERRAFKANLSEKTNNRNAAEDAKPQAKSAPAPAPTILKKPQAPPTPPAPKGPAASRAPPTEPAATRAASQPPAKAETATPRSQASAQVPANSSASPATGRQAFLKHANPSQGITEPLIEEALKVFGAIEKVEIDKRKGFAYVDFADPEGLKKAIAASPVKVAQGAVQVLERKEKVVRNRGHPAGPHAPPAGPARGRGGGFAGRGRGRGGGRGGHATAAAGTGDAAPAAASSTPAADGAS